MVDNEAVKSPLEDPQDIIHAFLEKAMSEIPDYGAHFKPLFAQTKTYSAPKKKAALLNIEGLVEAPSLVTPFSETPQYTAPIFTPSQEKGPLNAEDPPLKPIYHRPVPPTKAAPLESMAPEVSVLSTETHVINASILEKKPQYIEPILKKTEGETLPKASDTIQPKESISDQAVLKVTNIEDSEARFKERQKKMAEIFKKNSQTFGSA